MPFKLIVAKDFDHMSELAAQILVKDIKNTLNKKDTYVLGLATGNTPTGLYKRFAGAANAGEFDCSKIQSFNLDEHIGLPGENAQQRALHPESYSFFMVQELFGLLEKNSRKRMYPGAHSLIRKGLWLSLRPILVIGRSRVPIKAGRL
jgi:glucosamine-6-phosphate deaminase